jgi:hypothetical protein
MEPKNLIAGDSVAWVRMAAAYPPEAGWELLYVLRGAASLDIAATGGPEYRFEVSSAQSGTLSAGIYRWACYAKRGPERLTLARGEISVAEDLAEAVDLDTAGHARRMLAMIEAALEKRIPKDQQSYEIDGMRLDRIPIERLDALRTKYQREVARHNNRRPMRRRIYPRL